MKAFTDIKILASLKARRLFCWMSCKPIIMVNEEGYLLGDYYCLDH